MARIRYNFGSHHTRKLENIKKQRPKYPNVMKEVINISEIILEILDARFIKETRNEEIEASIIKSGKKLIFVINKADLVKIEKIEKTLPKRLKPYVFVSAKTGKGSRKLREKIKMEAKRVEIGDKKRVQIGVIGYPNCGKSSIINLITRRGVAKTSKQAGYTKGMQKIRLTDKILILDTPGVISESKYSTNSKRLLFENTKVGARTYSNVKDPESTIHYLMKKHSKAIEKFYKIKSKGNSEILIEELGKQKNFLKKRGKVDIDRTARIMLRDWQEGKIKF
tara:strand:- start:2782 stop:3621 length:840 start_codon:yes stop_codon:yes gene_type:complete